MPAENGSFVAVAEGNMLCPGSETKGLTKSVMLKFVSLGIIWRNVIKIIRYLQRSRQREAKRPGRMCPKKTEPA